MRSASAVSVHGLAADAASAAREAASSSSFCLRSSCVRVAGGEGQQRWRGGEGKQRSRGAGLVAGASRGGAAAHLLLEEGVGALLALLDVVLVVRGLARERHVPVVEARDAVEVLLGVGLVRHGLEHRLDLLGVVALLDTVLVVAHKDADVVTLVVLVLALAEADHGRRLGRRQVHHVLELEVLQLLLEFLDIKGAEALAAKVGHDDQRVRVGV